MNPSQYPALKQELQADPKGLGYGQYVTVADYTSVARLLNGGNPAFSKVAPVVPINSVLIWAAGGPMVTLTDYGDNTANPPALRSICLAAVKMFGVSTYLDLSDHNITTMLQTLVSAGILSAADQSNLLALQNVSPASRAEVLFGVGVEVLPFDVQQALAS